MAQSPNAAAPSFHTGERIGLFGGTFDPVHNGHLQIALGVRRRYCLERVIFLPALQPPHKEREITPFHHRVGMLAAALRGLPAMEISQLEARRRGPSYTYDTLRAVRREFGDESHYFLIIGADSFAEIHLWYRFRRLLAEVDLIVAARPDYPLDLLQRQFERLRPAVYDYREEDCSWYCAATGRSIHYFGEAVNPVSSSVIRERIGKGAAIDDLVPMAVHAYIRHHRLYRKFSSAGSPAAQTAPLP